MRHRFKAAVRRKVMQNVIVALMHIKSLMQDVSGSKFSLNGTITELFLASWYYLSKTNCANSEALWLHFKNVQRQENHTMVVENNRYAPHTVGAYVDRAPGHCFNGPLFQNLNGSNGPLFQNPNCFNEPLFQNLNSSNGPLFRNLNSSNGPLFQNLNKSNGPLFRNPIIRKMSKKQLHMANYNADVIWPSRHYPPCIPNA